MRIDSATPPDPYASLVNALNAQNVNALNSINQQQPIPQAQQPSSLIPSEVVANTEAHISNPGQLASADDILYMAALALTLPKALTAQTVTSSAPSIATASAVGVPPGNYAVQVTQLAQAQTVTSSVQADSLSPIGSGAATLNFAFASGLTQSIALGSGDNNLAAISSAINRANFGISARVLTTPTGAQLQLIGHTGAVNGFSVSASGNAALAQLLNTAPGGGLTQNTAALDAQGLMNGIAFSSSANTVFTAIPGLTLNLTGVGSATLEVAPPSVNINGVQLFVNAFNHLQAVLQQFEENIPESDLSPSSLMASLDNIVSQNQSALAGIGITSDQNFNLSLNREQFQAVLSANPTAVAQIFSNHGTGIAEQIVMQIQSNLSALNQQQLNALNEHRIQQEYEREQRRQIHER